MGPMRKARIRRSEDASARPARIDFVICPKLEPTIGASSSQSDTIKVLLPVSRERSLKKCNNSMALDCCSEH
eukprot:1739368-Karenia_brevis.AAC.1